MVQEIQIQRERERERDFYMTTTLNTCYLKKTKPRLTHKHCNIIRSVLKINENQQENKKEKVKKNIPGRWAFQLGMRE